MASAAEYASAILLLPEVSSGDSLLMDNEIPVQLATALTNEGLTVTRTEFSDLTSINTDHVLTTNTSLINKAIRNRKIDSQFVFVNLIMLGEEAVDGDLEENFELTRKGVHDFGDGETIFFSVWKLTRVWVNQ